MRFYISPSLNPHGYILWDKPCGFLGIEKSSSFFPYLEVAVFARMFDVRRQLSEDTSHLSEVFGYNLVLYCLNVLLPAKYV